MVALPLLSPIASEAATQVRGEAYFDAVECSSPPAGYDDYPGLMLTGSIKGCLYTNVLATKQTPGGVYLERGQEIIVGSLDGGRSGRFTTTYRFEAKYDPDSGVQQHGRCQHPILDGSGRGGFAGVDGRLDFKDIITDAGTTYEYRGHLSFR